LASQATQVRLEVGVPAASTCWPATQSVHGVHAVAFWVELNMPEAHAVQARSVVVVPAVETHCPGLQVVQGVHAATLVVVL
jgi:hypothetical protein